MHTVEILNQLTQLKNYPTLLITLTLWLTYSYIVLRGGFVSDDIPGIEQFDGTLQYAIEDDKGQAKKDSNGNVLKARKICYGTLSKWVRYHLCGGHFPSRHRYPKTQDGKEGDPIPSGKVPSHHHILSLVCANIAAVLLYHFLLTITTPLVALLTVLLFIVHPTCIQAVGWPSAIGYILSLICITASLNIGHWTSAQTSQWPFILGLSAIAFFQVWGVYAQAIPMFTWVIFLVLGQWELAIIAFLFSTAASAINLREYVLHRKSEFKKQNMSDSTYLNIRKPIVALKTIAYYLYLAILPIRLGLYHEWGFHYDKKMELWDWRAISGLLVVGFSIALFVTGTLPVKIAVVWFYAFFILFLNWITAQQWVTERYLYIPVIGLCLLASLFLQHLLPLYFFIFGMLLCRTLSHLPTYDNELRFYLSNTWNFTKSEVAYGNLGVAYASIGLQGASNDSWIVASSINPDYDVPFYNLYSKIKSNGLMMIHNGAYEQGLATIAQSIPMLEKVLSCKVIHFKDMWTNELNDLKSMIMNPLNFLLGELNRLENLKLSLTAELYKTNDQKRQEEIQSSINDSNVQVNNLKSFLSSKGVHVEFNPEKAFLNKLTQRR